MRNLWLIVGREYRQRVHSTSFKATTALGVVLILGLAFAPAITDRIESATGGSTVAVVDPGRELAPALQGALTEKLPNGEPRTKIIPVSSGRATEGKLVDGDYDGLLVPRGSGPDATFVYRSPQPGAETDALREVLGSLAAEQRLRGLGLSAEETKSAFTPVPVEVESTVGASGEEQEQKFWLVYALVFMLYLTVIQYGSMVAMSVVTEKSTRITELLNASVHPFDQMAGKIFGIGLLGLTQYACWIGAGLLALLVGRLRGSGAGLAAVPATTLLLFALFFVLGFLLYATILGALGSLLSRVEDAQQLMAPVYFLLMGGFFATFVAMAEPESTIAVVGSYLPFSSPLVMFARAELGQTPLWEVVLSVALLVATVAASIWAASKVYRIGVLTYGKRPSIAEATRLFLRG